MFVCKVSNKHSETITKDKVLRYDYHSIEFLITCNYFLVSSGIIWSGPWSQSCASHVHSEIILHCIIILLLFVLSYLQMSQIHNHLSVTMLTNILMSPILNLVLGLLIFLLNEQSKKATFFLSFGFPFPCSTS